jgi:SEC-C motif domain protein
MWGAKAMSDLISDSRGSTSSLRASMRAKAFMIKLSCLGFYECVLIFTIRNLIELFWFIMETKTKDCPCSSSRIRYADCCGRYLDGGEATPTAEALMRSRYTAYTFGREDYLLATWHHSTRPASLKLANEPRSKWLGLEVKRHEQLDSHQAVVEFVARYKVNGRAYRLHEISRFVREAGQWCYVNGDII